MQTLFKYDDFKLDDIFKINKQVISFLDKMREVTHMSKSHFNQKYQDDLMPLKEILQGSIDYYFDNKKPFVLKFE